jgi:putative nucleotidyltransferase with HDIG domain
MLNQTLCPVTGATIELGPIPFDLYAGDSRGGVLLFCRRGFEITPRHKDALDRSGRIFYVANDSMDLYFDYAFDRLARIVESLDIRPIEKARIMRGVGMRIVRRLMEDPRSSDAMERGGKFIEAQVELILGSREVTNHLFALAAAAGYTLAHSINVSTFCVLLGEELYGPDLKQLRLLGLGGLLHDLGMTRIDSAVVNKEGPLNDSEWREIYRHTVLGYEIVLEHGLPDPVPAICRSHHERMRGGGYPDGLRGEEIHPFARVAAMADVYDAMTSERTYHKKMPHVQALSKISESVDDFDGKVFTALLRIVLHNDKLVEQFLARGLRAAALR